MRVNKPTPRIEFVEYPAKEPAGSKEKEAMRALRKMGPQPGLELVEIPKPEPGYREVLIRVHHTGLCGTDLHLQSWDHWAETQVHPPQTLGHEFCGVIAEIGPGVAQGFGTDELHVGQRVSVEGHVVCGRCRNCRAGRRHMCLRTLGIGVNRDGAFADYVCVPASNVWVQPESIDTELGALFDPFGNAVHTCQQVELTGQDVLITGAGPIGIMCAAIARHAGARHVVITDPSASRRSLAEIAEPDAIVDPTSTDLRDVQAKMNMTEGFDVGLEMSGHPSAMAQMIDNCNHGATLALLGLPKDDYAIDWGKVITHMLTIKGVYGREMFDTWYLATFMLESTPWLREALRKLITHRFSAEEWEQAFAAAASGKAGKVIIDWR